MSYNTQLQENNTSLNSVLSKVNNLPDKQGEKGLVIEKWDFILEDGSVISKYVEHQKVYNISYTPFASKYVISSNTQKTILHGETYITTLTTIEEPQIENFMNEISISYNYSNGRTVKEIVYSYPEYWGGVQSYTITIKDLSCDIEIDVGIIGEG